MKFSKTVLKNLFSKPATCAYPAVPCEFKERTRGHVHIDIDACTLCGLCSKKCPTGAITVDRAGKTWSINRFDCIQCSACADSCPKKCLRLANEYTAPDATKNKDVYEHA